MIKKEPNEEPKEERHHAMSLFIRNKTSSLDKIKGKQMAVNQRQQPKCSAEKQVSSKKVLM
jgi:hypothetical protein